MWAIADQLYCTIMYKFQKLLSDVFPISKNSCTCGVFVDRGRQWSLPDRTFDSVILSSDKRTAASAGLGIWLKLVDSHTLHFVVCLYAHLYGASLQVLMHRILLGQCPPYLADLVTFSADDTHRRRLRSSTNRAAVIQQTKTPFGTRAFSVSGPAIWNSLPLTLRSIDSHQCFRRRLKTYLFNMAFN